MSELIVTKVLPALPVEKREFCRLMIDSELAGYIERLQADLQFTRNALNEALAEDRRRRCNCHPELIGDQEYHAETCPVCCEM